jgi:acylphosphatase
MLQILPLNRHCSLLFLLLLSACSGYNPPVSTTAPQTPTAIPTTQPTATMAKSAKKIEFRTILFSGNVQGVGFRATVVDLSRNLDLAGEVKNLSDGRVELLIEGPPADIDRLLARLREHFGDFIRRVDQDVSAPRGLQPGVRVTY